MILLLVLCPYLAEARTSKTANETWGTLSYQSHLRVAVFLSLPRILSHPQTLSIINMNSQARPLESGNLSAPIDHLRVHPYEREQQVRVHIFVCMDAFDAHESTNYSPL